MGRESERAMRGGSGGLPRSPTALEVAEIPRMQELEGAARGHGGFLPALDAGRDKGGSATRRSAGTLWGRDRGDQGPAPMTARSEPHDFREHGWAHTARTMATKATKASRYERELEEIDLISKSWGDQGRYMHTLHNKRYSKLAGQCKANIEARRVALSHPDSLLLEDPHGKGGWLSLSLDIHRVQKFRDGEQLPRVPGARQGSQTERLARLQPPEALRTMVDDKLARRLWLRDTTHLTLAGAMEPFALAPPPPYVPPVILPAEKLESEADIVRFESKRLCSALHRINCSFRKGGKHGSVTAEQRRETMNAVLWDLKRLNESVVAVADTIGPDKEAAPPRYDFVRANKHLLHLSDPRVRRAKAVRQSVVQIEKSEESLLRNSAQQLEHIQEVTHAVQTRSSKARQRLREMEAARSALTGRDVTWLQAIAHASFAARLWERTKSCRDRRTRAAVLIQKTWRGYWIRHWQSKQGVLIKLALKMPKLVQKTRAQLKERSADVLKSFLLNLKEALTIRAAMRAFRARTIFLQQTIREYLKHSKAVRARYVAQFEKVEKGVLHRLVREKTALQERRRHKIEAAAHEDEHTPTPHHLPGDPHYPPIPHHGHSHNPHYMEGWHAPPEHHHMEIDWGALAADLQRLAVAEDIKQAMCKEMLRVRKVAFTLKKQQWKQEMAEYMASFRQTLLFRTEVQEILEGTDLEHMGNSLEMLAGNNKGIRDLIQNMNKVLPPKPVFKEAASDERMRDLVRQCLAMSEGRNLSVRVLLAGQPKQPVVIPPPAWLQKMLDWESKTLLK